MEFIPPQNPASEYPSLELAFDLTREQLGRQLDEINSLDSKANFVLGAASLLTGLSTPLTTLHPPADITHYPIFVQILVRGLPIIAIGCYLLVLITAYKAYQVGKYMVVPKLARLHDYLSQPKEFTTTQIFSTMVTAFNYNAEKKGEKAQWLRIALRLLIIEAVILTIMVGSQVIL